MIIKRRSCLLIPKEYESESFYTNIRADLTRMSRSFGKDTITATKYFIDTSEGMMIPRYYPVEKFIKDCEIFDFSSEGEDIEINHHITPKNEVQQKAIDHLLGCDSATLRLDPGVGKTVISIFVVSTRKKKTIVISHRESLIDQWKERFLMFTDLKEDDIAIVNSSNYNKVLDRKILLMTDQAFNAMMRSDDHRKPFLTAILKSNIGIFIADEVHTSVGAPTFSETSLWIPAKVTYGLSATPERSDGNHDVIYYHMGPVFSDLDSGDTVPARVTMFAVNYDISTPKRHKYLHWDGEFQRARYLNLIHNSIPANKLYLALLKKLFNDGKDIIFVSERIKHLEAIEKEITKTTDDCAKFVSGSSSDALSKTIVLSTPGKIRDGIDVPRKNCLVMTSPISNISQISGRVVRAHKGKEFATIIDIVDIGCPEIYRSANSRIAYYEDKKWSINYIFVSPDGKLNKITKAEFTSMINTKANIHDNIIV